MIMACDAAGGIARKGTLPWPKNTKDLAWFKRHTTGCVVVMGSKTWQDPFMPSPLPGRYNVVVTSKPEENPGADAYITKNLCEEVKKLEQEKGSKDKPIWIIGGANLVDQLMPEIDRFYITIMDEKYDCDTFLPLKSILRQPELASKHAEGMTVKILEKFNTGKE